ncbi:MAG: hypothetical protein RLZZ384_322 [Pseudomonadota bacterium]|jgi:hypothetical protein
MKHTHKAMQHNKDSLSKEIFKGSIASAVVYSGSKVMSIAVKNPIVVFGLGVVSGFLIHKYRKDIIASTTKVVDAGKDFVLQQKENLEDLVAETKEN